MATKKRPLPERVYLLQDYDDMYKGDEIYNIKDKGDYWEGWYSRGPGTLIVRIPKRICQIEISSEMLNTTVQIARENVNKMKKAVPHIFPEWQRVRRAKLELEAAKEELKAAEKAWKAL